MSMTLRTYDDGDRVTILGANVPDVTIFDDGHVLTEHRGNRFTIACPHGQSAYIPADHDGYAYAVQDALDGHRNGDACHRG